MNEPGRQTLTSQKQLSIGTACKGIMSWKSIAKAIIITMELSTAAYLLKKDNRPTQDTYKKQA